MMKRFMLCITLVAGTVFVGLCGGDEPPRAEMKLLRCGALYRDDFSSGSPATKPWRIWPSPKGEASFVRFENGEFRASAAGLVWGRTTDGDCVVATDVAHEPGTVPYGCQQVHLCAGSGGSADYSVQAYLVTDGKRTYCVSEYHTEPGTEGVTLGYIRDPKKPMDGVSWPDDGRLRTALVERNAETQLGTVYVRPEAEWIQCGRPRRFPFSGLGVELKSYSRNLKDKPAVARWDNYRIYPRAASHYACVHVVSQDGKPVAEPGLTVQLLDADGKLLVAQAALYQGRGLLRLSNAPWIGYPVACRLRLVREGKLCAEGVIEQKDVAGLYPADAWEMKVAWPPTKTLPLPETQASKRPTPKVVQSPEDHPPADMSFLKKRTLPTFTKITSVKAPTRAAETGTFLADDFEAAALDGKVWQERSGSAEIASGALRLSNGAAVAASLNDHTDVVAAGDVRLPDAGSAASVRIVGGPMGPAYAAGITLQGSGKAAFEYLTEPGTEGMKQPDHGVTDPGAVTVEPRADGMLSFKIERVDDTGKARCFVKGRSGWRQVGQWRTVPMYDVKLILQARKGAVVFDNVRAYPRPEVKYAFFRIQANLSKEERAKYEGDPIHREIVVELYDADGARLVGRARGYHGSTHVPLSPDVWPTYPAAGVFKVFYLDQQVGEARNLPAKGVDGLYPGGLWRVAIE